MASIEGRSGAPGSGGAPAIENAFQRHLENPFWVLALPPGATAAEIDRQGQKWLDMLAAGLVEACRYVTPVGVAERSADQVRAAMAELADPARRLGYEWWIRGFTSPGEIPC